MYPVQDQISTTPGYPVRATEALSEDYEITEYDVQLEIVYIA